MDNVIYYYTTKGKKIHEFTPGGDITCIEPFFYNPKQYYGLFVVVGNEIRLYIDYLLVDRIKSEAQVSWIKFGGLGREEAVLIIVSKTGSLAVKMFKRTAVLDDKEFLKNNGGLQVMKLTIPKKTKAFVSQGMREKTNADLIFKIFQRDLFMLKLYITKSYAELQSSNLASLGFSDDFSAIEVQVDVLGFGPMFRVVINMSSGKKITLRNLKIMFSYNKDLYSMKNDIIDICYLLPNYPQSLVVPVEAKQLATGQSGDICMKIMESYQLPALIPPSKQKPLVTHAFTMPVCETDFLE
uniref:BBS1 domain-containing protein n=1 Tax=Rhabditophanes sp. KR3021 TaxID=114890 RepID=A0AC35U5X1_9BILA